MKNTVKFSKLAYKLDQTTIDEIKEEVKEYGVDLDDVEVIRKSWASEEKAELQEGSRTAIKYVSTRTVDLSGDIVVPKGVMVKQFEKNGSPVFYNHNYSLPQVGADEWVKKDAWGVKVKQRYADTGEGTLANILWKLTSQGMNTQSSVGIIPLEVIRVGDDNFNSAIKELKKEWPELSKTFKGCSRIITKSLMFEHSDVAMACNTDTDVLSVSKRYSDAGADEALLKQLGLSVNVEVEEEDIDEGSADKDGEEVTVEVDMDKVVDVQDDNVSDEVDVEDLEVVDVEKVEKVQEVEETPVVPVVKEKSKVTLVKEPYCCKLIQAPSYNKEEIKRQAMAEVRKKMGRLV